MSGIPQIYDSFEEWLANPRDDNTSMKFKPDYSPPENSNEAFKRYGIAGESFFNAMKEAQYQPKMVNGNVEVKYNRAFNNIDTNKAWQLWEDNGAPIVKDKGSSSLLAREESTAPKFTPLEMGKINKVLQSTGASMLQTSGNPLLATMTEFPPQEIDIRTEKEKELELFENVNEVAYEAISGALDILTDD